MPNKKLSRRDAIKIMGAAIGATALANLPSKWSTPELVSGVLPAHAQTSVVVSCVGYAPGSQTFSTPGILDFVVPACVTSLTVDAYGAQGAYSDGNGGLGGRATFNISVTPGEILTVLVGGVGGVGGASVGGVGGLNGGGTGGNGSGGSGGSGGGGWSGVQRGSTMLIVAGGGGGAAYDNGGFGGGVTGGNGTGISPGFGGTQGAGGVAGGSGATAGSSGTGGNGGSDFIGGGGGGSGYFGGGGGGNGSGGGGGSSYPPVATHQQGVRSGNGQVILTW